MDVGAAPANRQAQHTAQVVEASAYWVRAPLTKPYGLSFATLSVFDLVLVRFVGEDGTVAFGESCPVPPYSPESSEQVWARVCEVLADLRGRDPRAALDLLVELADGSEAFSYVAPATALESLLDPPDSSAEVAVPVVGTVQAADERQLPAEVERLLALGHRTLKVKVGFDPADDLRRVRLLQRYCAAEVQLRLDANEAWDRMQAGRFLAGLDPSGIELVEQPVPRERWDWFCALADEHREVPLMLDESISSESSVRRAAEAGARIVKFKLMKAGSRRVLRRRMDTAAGLGLSVVVGNGVAGVVDNWHEALCARSADRVGEMNGNLKLSDAVFADRPVLRDGLLRFPAGFSPTADAAALERRSHRVMRAW
jgi:L-alanine-DL-glutamate epimerase-like enolase superfamily enzyme